MKRSLAMVGVAFALTLAGAAEARPVTVDRLRQDPREPENFLVDGHYLRGEALLAGMRRRGELPDTLHAGRCRFDLAGDPGVAYYVRTCH